MVDLIATTRRNVVRLGAALAVVTSLTACPLPWENDVWTAEKLREWHATWGAATGYRPEAALYYRGSDSQYHHFRCRPIDSWVHMAVPKGEITIDDERPLGATSSESTPFPGYYAVDPSDGFKRIR